MYYGSIPGTMRLTPQGQDLEPKKDLETREVYVVDPDTGERVYAKWG
jgi:hypothetical protein